MHAFRTNWNSLGNFDFVFIFIIIDITASCSQQRAQRVRVLWVSVCMEWVRRQTIAAVQCTWNQWVWQQPNERPSVVTNSIYFFFTFARSHSIVTNFMWHALSKIIRICLNSEMEFSFNRWWRWWWRGDMKIWFFFLTNTHNEKKICSERERCFMRQFSHVKFIAKPRCGWIANNEDGWHGYRLHVITCVILAGQKV